MTEPSPEPVIAISAKDLSKRYRLELGGQKAPHLALLSPLLRLFGGGAQRKTASNEFWALHGVTFEVKQGDRVAVIGRNGAGKTTLLKILSRIVPPTSGEARIRGRLTSLLEVGTGFNNALTGRENVFVNASLHGLSKRDTAERFDQIVEFSGMDSRFIDMRVKHYSSGMRLRLAFSIAAHLDPDIMLLDEVLAVGDMAFQEKCLERVEGMMKAKRTIMFVSHDMASVTRFCERAIWLEQGHVILDGPSKDVALAYSEQARKAVTARRWTPESTVSGFQPSPADGSRNGAAASGSGQLLDEPQWKADQTLQEPPSAEMVSVCVVGSDGRELKAATVDQRIGIEFVYDVLRDGKVVLPAANFYTPDDILMFTAVYTDPTYMQRPKKRGRYLSILWVPPHLLSPGAIHVTVSLTTPVSGKLERHVVIAKALSFEVYEAPFGVLSARGTYRDVKGVVRPLLSWETRALDLA